MSLAGLPLSTQNSGYQTQDQTKSAFNLNADDHEYFASSVEEIDVGRDSVTSLAAEPPHVFDIVWNMDLNTALGNAGIKVPYQLDAGEQEHKAGTGIDKFVYKLTTGTVGPIEFECSKSIGANNVKVIYYYDDAGSASTRTGSGVDEAAAMADLAKQLKVESISGSDILVVLSADRLQDDDSNMSAVMVTPTAINQQIHKVGVVDDAKLVYELVTGNFGPIEIECSKSIGTNNTDLIYSYVDDGSASTRTGSGVDEEAAMADLAKQLKVDESSNLVVLSADRLQDVGSTMSAFMVDSVSSGVVSDEHKAGTDIDTFVYELVTDGFGPIEFECSKSIGASNTELIYYYDDDDAGNAITSIRTGSGVDEEAAMADLAKQLKVDVSGLVVLSADRLQDVGSTMSAVMVVSASSGVGNSFAQGHQNNEIVIFEQNLKSTFNGIVPNWYSANPDNNRSVTVQVKSGLAQLFDRKPELNNLLGSAASASTFLDSALIAAKMQDSNDDFYKKLFSRAQLKEVLEAVADKGSRVENADNISITDRKYEFQAGDSITAVVKVKDSDAGGTNSDRWLITLQQTA